MSPPDPLDARRTLGHGVGLRVPHYEGALRGDLDVDWIEVVTENFFAPGGRPMAVLERARRDHPVALHGVSLAIGSDDAPPRAYLDRLAELCERIDPVIVSDHLCWGRHGGQWAHDLLPLPATAEALRVVVERVARVQDRLGRRILLENPARYVAHATDEMPHWELLRRVAEEADCLILFDVNNAIVDATNFDFDPRAWLDGLPGDRIAQLHVAGHTDRGSFKIDTHRGPVPDAVWDLYVETQARLGPLPSLVEWDEEVPTWEVLRAEQRRAAALCREACG